MEGNFESAVVKASYGGHTRKWKLTGGSSLSDLVNAVRHEFGVGGSSLHLKYKDSEGDLIELTSDEDLALAIELEKSLVIVASNESDDLPKSVVEFRASLNGLIATATDLFNSLDNLNLAEKKSNVVSTQDAISSPVKTEQVATIDPSVLEEVHLNDLSNGTVQESKPTYDNGIQTFQPLKSAHLDEPIGHQPLPPSIGQQPLSGNFPPTNTFTPPPAIGQQLPPPSPLSHQQQPLSHLQPNFGQPSGNLPPSSYGQPLNYGQPNLPPTSFAPPSGQPSAPVGLPPSGVQGQQQYQPSAPGLPPIGQNQQYQPPPPSSFAPPPSSFAPTPNSFAPTPNNFAPPPSSFAPPPNSFAPSSLSSQQPLSHFPPVSQQQQQGQYQPAGGLPPTSFPSFGQQQANPFQRN